MFLIMFAVSATQTKSIWIKEKEMLITNKWETLAEVSNRTRTPGDAVLSEFQRLYKEGRLQFRFDEQDGIKVTLIRLKQEN